MGKTLAKKISKLNKVPHPKGRKAAQLSKKAIREAGRERIKLLHHMKENLIGEKLLWFKENLDPVENYTPELTIKLVERYLCRFDEELQQIQLKHSTGKRKGRQHANREDIIKMTIKNERNQFSTCGIEMPDVLNSKQLIMLRNWSGELRYIQNFSLVRYSKYKLEKMKSRQHLNAETKEKDVSSVDIAEDGSLKQIENKSEEKSQKMELD